jgi:hypothetical protein
VLLIAGLAPASQIAVVLLDSRRLDEGQLPADWHLKVTHGKADYQITREGALSAIHLKTADSSFALERSADVDPYETRYLAWSWKVAQLPAGGDFRQSATDDQAAQVLVGFDDRRVLAYIWDTTSPKGVMETTSLLPLIHLSVTVCESGAAQVNSWVSEVRDVAADFERAFGKRAPRVKGLRLQINSQHTGTIAESYFGDISFRASQP